MNSSTPLPTPLPHIAVVLLVLAVFSCDSFIENPDERPWDGPAAVWKVLWVICPETIFPSTNLGEYSTSMTAAEIELVKEKAKWFEDFVEKASRYYVDIQITIEIMQNPLIVPNANPPPLPAADKARLEPEKNFDSCIMTADYTGVEVPWRAINGGFNMIIPFKKNEWSWTYEAPDAGTREYHTNLYVHEWCHLLEWHFGSVLGYEMPVLHNDTAEYAYSVENTGLDGEARLVKWYSDFIAGTITSYPGATNNKKGVHPSWWQHTPRNSRGNTWPFSVMELRAAQNQIGHTPSPPGADYGN